MEVSDRLECILTPATWWTPIKMCNRRNKPICQGAFLLALVGGLGYTMYLYSNISMDLEISRSETDKYFKQQESLSSQLQGVCSFVVDHRRKLLIVSSILMNLYIGEEPVKFFLCFVAIVRVRVYYLDFFVLFCLFYVSGECYRFLHRDESAFFTPHFFYSYWCGRPVNVLLEFLFQPLSNINWVTPSLCFSVLTNVIVN